MTHRVHTILSILAEDHAPAALRPSILLAIDWPTVAMEAPATGDDATAATLAALRIRGAITSYHQALAPCAARLATVAASLTTTADKAMATHATALWGAAAALVGLTTSASATNVDQSTAEVYLRALAHKANSLMFGMSRTPAEQAAIIGTVIDKIKAHEFTDHEHRLAAHDKALADIHALRDILKVPAGGNIVDHADAAMKGAAAASEDNTRLRAQVDRMIAAMREDAPAPVKACPQPGDVVQWAEVEDGCLYFDAGDEGGAAFAACRSIGSMWLVGPNDRDLLAVLREEGWGVPLGTLPTPRGPAILVARDLGTDPEAWRAAMREWTANGNKSHATGRRSCPHRQDGDASACDHCCMFG